jgi:hypothetical protein
MLATVLFLPSVATIHASKSISPISCARWPFLSGLRVVSGGVRGECPYHFGGYESSRWSWLSKSLVAGSSARLASRGKCENRIWRRCLAHDSRDIQPEQRNLTFSSAPVIACDWPQTLCARDLPDRHCYYDLQLFAPSPLLPSTNTAYPLDVLQHANRQHGRTEQAGKDGKLRARTAMALPCVDGHS